MLCGVLILTLLVSAQGQCDLETMGLSELKELVNLLAVRSPFSLLRLMEEIRLQPPIKVLDGIEIPLPSYAEPPSQESIFPFHPPKLNNIKDTLPSYSEPNPEENIFPLQPTTMLHGINRPLVPSYAVPDAPPALIPLPLRPPAGATVRVLSSPDDLLEVPVVVSPLMQLAEVLRQAGFSFGHGTEDCIRLSRAEHAGANDSFGWKVSVADRHGQVLYDDLCLPNEKEVIVKPGTVISLSYIPLPNLNSLIDSSSNQEDVNLPTNSL